MAESVRRRAGAGCVLFAFPDSIAQTGRTIAGQGIPRSRVCQRRLDFLVGS